MTDEELKTNGDIMNAMSRVLKDPTPQVAADHLMEKLLWKHPYARQNVGYLAGYFSPDEAQVLYRLFRTSHPVFGTTSPTPEEALAAGVRIGEMMKAEQS